MASGHLRKEEKTNRKERLTGSIQVIVVVMMVIN